MSPVEPGNSESERLNESSSGFSDSKLAARLHVSFGLYEFNSQTHELLKGGLRLKKMCIRDRLSSIVTVDMIWSLGLLVAGLPSHRQTPQELLRSATALWITNILVFASWYWRLDAGGPRERELRGVHTDGAFLFPQMTLDQRAKREMGEQCWSPGFVLSLIHIGSSITMIAWCVSSSRFAFPAQTVTSFAPSAGRDGTYEGINPKSDRSPPNSRTVRTGC